MSTNGIAFTSGWHVQQPTWTEVDGYTVSHLHPASRPNSKALIHALRNSRDQGLPDISTAPVVGKFFALQCRAKGVRHALELGTLGAYTSIWLATENPGLKVTTIEVDPGHRAVAQQNLEFAGVQDRVDCRLGAGLDVLPQLVREIQNGEKDRIGFVYIDADKVNNWNYIDVVAEACESGAVIFVDNIVRGGALVDPKQQNSSGTKGARRVVESLGQDERFDSMVMQFVGEKGYDGFVMAVVR